MKVQDPNVRYVCPVHAPKPGKYADSDARDFLGTNVKVGFLAPDGRVEHMWVYVIEANQEENSLQGIINNDPVYATQYSHGQYVEVQTWEIEDVIIG